MKVKRVVRVAGVMRVAVLRFFPADDLAHVLDQRFAFGNVDKCKHTFAVHTGAANLNTAICRGSRFFGHG